MHPRRDNGTVQLRLEYDEKMAEFHFNVTLLSVDWDKFSIKLFRHDTPSLYLCRTYYSPEERKLNTISIFQLKVDRGFNMKAMSLLYEIEKEGEKDIYGKFAFYIPSKNR